jgi:very-short-patch-repair endonuclease
MKLYQTVDLKQINRRLGTLDIFSEKNVYYLDIYDFVKIFGYASVGYLTKYYNLSLYKRYYVKFNEIAEVFLRGRKDYLKQVYRLISNNLGYQVVPSKTKESNVCENIIELLDDESIEYVRQYKCGKYLIDLYIPEKNIVIEINENNHVDRSVEYEIQREQFITNKLGCLYHTINPDNPKFSIYKMNKKIYELISDY